ncbi:MAG: hypothetical protein IT537_24610 [Hyphomicrobiales bacterium]|nr:hypothetical protein [Hyphomicrobiales bacterium]
MLGLNALGRLALGQLEDGSGTSVTAPIGSGISGGAFSRGRWRKLKEAERQGRAAAERARERVEERVREAARHRAAQERAAVAAARRAEDAADARRAREQAAKHLRAGIEVSDDTLGSISAAQSQTSAAAMGARQIAEQDEEEAVMHLLLLLS